MMKSILLSIVLAVVVTFGIPTDSLAQKDDGKTRKIKAKIESLLRTQVDQWNKADLKGFMATYWNSEKLTFSSGGQTLRGWQATFDRYKKRYQSDGAEMGVLNFDGIEIEMLSPNACYVLGNWYLKMKNEKRQGNFSLVLRKFDNGWKIIHDHSSSLDEKESD